jgi:transposase InsO family protein
MIAFIDEHMDRETDGLRWGIEPICGQLPIAPATYYAWKQRPRSARSLRDEYLQGEIMRVWTENYRVYGAEKIWWQLNRDGIGVARCTVERLMRSLGIRGAVRGKRVFTTIPDLAQTRPADLLGRDFTAPAPNRRWVSDFTYVRTRSGFCYVAFVIDCYARVIVGWNVAPQMTTDLVLTALEQAIWSRLGGTGTSLKPGEVLLGDHPTPTVRPIHHSDAGSQYLAIAYTQTLIDARIDPSVGTVGDSYDNALAESVIGLYKTELVRNLGPWSGQDDLELETMIWVHWWNHRRLINRLTPNEREEQHYRHAPQRDLVAHT